MTFTKTVQLPVDLDEAFALVTQPERLRRWQTVSAQVDLRTGGDYRWTVTPGHLVSGTFREVDPGKRVVFSWGWDGSAESEPSTVTITMEPSNGGTSLTLTHEGLNEQEAAGHAEGWNHFLERLELAAKTGVDAGHDSWADPGEDFDQFAATEASLAVLQGVLRRLTDEDRVKQTPCAEYDCHHLAEHLFGSIALLGQMGGTEVTNPEEGSLENRVSVMADQAITAWRARGLEGMVGAEKDFPAALAINILPLEFLVHAWDFAQASGQELAVNEDLAAYVLGLAEQVVPGAREGGSFAAPVDTPSDASAMERLVAYSGRSPLVAA